MPSLSSCGNTSQAIPATNGSSVDKNAVGKTLNANFLTSNLCGEEDYHRFLFHNRIYRRKKLKNIKQADVVLRMVTIALYS